MSAGLESSSLILSGPEAEAILVTRTWYSRVLTYVGCVHSAVISMSAAVPW